MKLLTTKPFITFLFSVFLVAVMYDVASANTNVNENDGKSVFFTEKTETNKKKKSTVLQDKTNSQKASSVDVKKKSPSVNNPTVSKQNEIKSVDSESVLSYNYIFYLVYEFKFSDILSFSKDGESQNTIDRPFADVLFDKGKSLFNRLISGISY